MNDFLFMVFACEEMKKEEFINALSQEPNPNDPCIQEEIANRVGLDFNLLSDWERQEIEREVANRWPG